MNHSAAAHLYTSIGGQPHFTSAHDRETVPWRNGQGTTQVVAETVDWRVSIADEPVASTFSVITGFDRLFTPIGTVPITLTGPPIHSDASPDAPEQHRVEPLETLLFPGEWAPHCRVDEPTRALNVMGRRETVQMSVRISETTAPTDPNAVRIYVNLGTADAVIFPPGEFAPPAWEGIHAVISITRR